MVPPRTARTFEEDPNFMILYHAFTSVTEKPDYQAIATKTGLPTAAAVKKRLDRLLKLQADAENDDDEIATPTTTSTTAKKAAVTGGKKGKDTKSGGEANKEVGDGGNGKSTAKKRKLTDTKDGSEISNDEAAAEKEIEVEADE